MTLSSSQLQEQVMHLLDNIYSPLLDANRIELTCNSILELMRLSSRLELEQPELKSDSEQTENPHEKLWDETSCVLITYGNTFLEDGQPPLHNLKDFLDRFGQSESGNKLLNSVHILPFFPYSSDDGFSVMDFSTVNPALGDWQDIKAISDDYQLMGDLVINHCSARSYWFENFIAGKSPGKDYFYTASPDTDLSHVVRPRTSPILRSTNTSEGLQHVWCTFSHDQVDFNFKNPQVLLEFIQIIRLYLDMGVRIFRLDAVAFLWKEEDTSCINLEQTHQMVRLLRLLIEHAHSDAIIITETNIPNRENLSYFGNANEAHCIYNFSLPPLLINTLLTGNSHYLKLWLMSMPPAQLGTTYFNFIASHDGIGLRPIEGILSDQETDQLIEAMQNFGGHVSWRALKNDERKPYEINISLFDALKGTIKGEDEFGIDRFLCAHTIMFALEGIPGLYVHSLLATQNDYLRIENTGHYRSINRHQWPLEEISILLEDQNTHHYQIYTGIKHLLEIRQQQAAFHPNATQFTLHLGDQIFAFWRQSLDRTQSIFCIHNISDQEQTVFMSDINLIATDQWQDLLTGMEIDEQNQKVLLKPYQCLWISNN